jgi:hypothetical protein
MRSVMVGLAALAALWAGPAGATRICPDANGFWHPFACDLILPIDPDQPSHECSFETWWAWHSTGASSDELCDAYWNAEATAHAKMCFRLSAIDPKIGAQGYCAGTSAWP